MLAARRPEVYSETRRVHVTAELRGTVEHDHRLTLGDGMKFAQGQLADAGSADAHTLEPAAGELVEADFLEEEFDP